MEKYNFIINTFWSFLSQAGAIIISLIANIILARLLSPSEFGQIGIIMFFVTLMNAFADGGLGGALVRKQEVDDRDFSTVFLFNLFLSIILYISLYISSNFIAEFYNDSKLIFLIRITGLMIIINAFSIIQNAKVYLKMAFKLNMKVNLFSTIVGSVIGIFLALNDYGIWSLVFMNISILFIRTIYLWLYFGSIKITIFDKKIFKSLFSYGFFTTMVSLLSSISDNVLQLVLAKYFTMKQSGYYYQAKKIQGSPYSILNTAVLGVFFSQLSKYQNDEVVFYNNYITIFKVFAFTCVGITSMFLVSGDEIIIILFGTAWMPSVIYMKLLSVAALFYILKTYSQNILKIYNKAGYILKFEIINYVLQALFILLGIYFKDVVLLLVGLIISNIFGFVVSTYFSWKLLNLKSSVEYIYVLKLIGIALLIIYILNLKEINWNIYVMLFYKLTAFVIIYIIFSFGTRTISRTDLQKLKF